MTLTQIRGLSVRHNEIFVPRSTKHVGTEMTDEEWIRSRLDDGSTNIIEDLRLALQKGRDESAKRICELQEKPAEAEHLRDAYKRAKAENDEARKEAVRWKRLYADAKNMVDRNYRTMLKALGMMNEERRKRIEAEGEVARLRARDGINWQERAMRAEDALDAPMDTASRVQDLTAILHDFAATLAAGISPEVAAQGLCRRLGDHRESLEPQALRTVTTTGLAAASISEPRLLVMVRAEDLRTVLDWLGKLAVFAANHGMTTPVPELVGARERLEQAVPS